MHLAKSIYEYKREYIRPGDPIDPVNSLAREGWRVISTCIIANERYGATTMFVLEREVGTV